MHLRSNLSGRHIAGVAAAAALSLSVGTAHAGDCSALSHPVYVTGSSAVKPFLAKVAAKVLADDIHVIYYQQGSCAGVTAMGDGAPAISQNGVTIWDNTGTEIAGGCDALNATVDIGASDVYADSCGKTVAAGVKDFHGPIQTMTFAVPKSAAATAISAEAAYLVEAFGDGATHPVEPWTNPTAIFQRDSGSGTQIMISKAIKVDAGKWKAQPVSGGSTGMAGVIKGATTEAEATLGILATDLTDVNRATIKILAYQHYDQTCGFLPDSTAQSFDKANVRDGHYMIWGPLHLYTAATGASSDTIANEDVKKVVKLLDLSGAATDVKDIIATEAKAGVIPDCAMHVKRDGEVGALMSYSPPQSCECAFLDAVKGPDTPFPSDCKACADASECTSGGRGAACNFGFCEVQ